MKNEIGKLENFKKDLEEKALTAFLTPEVESSYDRLLDFLSKSQDACVVRYGLIEQYRILGQERSSYHVLSKKIGPKMINAYRRVMLALNLLKRLNWMSGLVNYDLKIVLDSAPPASKDFDDQLSKFLIDLKEKIKGITLGTK